MVGPNALLDCNGFKIFSTNLGQGVAVQLLLGASMMNCNIGNVENAIEIVGDGCSTVMNVDTSFTAQDAIVVRGTGKKVLSDITIHAAGDDGIEVNISPEDLLATSNVILSNVFVDGAVGNGIHLVEAAPTGTTVSLFGKVVIEKAGSNGFEVAGSALGPSFEVTSFCDLSVFASGEDGISLSEMIGGSFTLGAGSSVTSCFNAGSDFNGNNITSAFAQLYGASTQCDTVSDAGNFGACDLPCVVPPYTSTPGSAIVCV